MDKDFDNWNIVKKQLEQTGRIFYAHPREIWWCSLGINIGAEINGKHENFERPVIIIKVYSKESLIALPLTTKEKNDIFHYKIDTEEKTVWVKLTQTRVISTKRLIRKVDILDKSSFDVLLLKWEELL
jgi:mRNA interferase MazF